MLDHLEADNAIEAIRWPGGVARDKGVVGIHLRKAGGTEQLRKNAIAAPVIQNALGLAAENNRHRATAFPLGRTS